jgi:regulation of enolase protein 1 (concanavalin A-like superfamily)
VENEFVVAGIPEALRWELPPVSWKGGDGALTATAGPRTDLFIDPDGGAPKLTAPRLLATAPAGDFTFSARVGVDFATDFDAGVLLLHATDEAWAKLCFEYSPQGEAMVVSVVTRGVSDDANAFVVDGGEVWLRISRRGGAYAFHASEDGQLWQFVRQFALPEPAPVRVGLAPQSPTGEGCTVTFDEIRFAAERLEDLRSGE